MDGTDLKSSLGNVARGAGFFDREAEVADLVGYLDDGTSLLLVGPRRIGKTSVVHRTLEVLRTRGVATVFVDVQDLHRPEQLIAEIAGTAAADAGVLERLRQRFARVFERLEHVEVAHLKVELAAELTADWREQGHELLELLVADGPVVLAIDELPILLNRSLNDDPETVGLLLGVLRKASDALPDLRLLVSGSIGLEPILHRAGLTGQVTYLHKYTLEPWDETTTTAAVQALGAGFGLQMQEPAAATVHARLGAGVPYHVQLFVDALRVDARHRGASSVTARDVVRVYEERLLTDDIVEAEDERAEALREVLAILQHDAYLERRGGAYRFSSRLVQDWWRERNDFGYVPAEERRS